MMKFSHKGNADTVRVEENDTWEEWTAIHQVGNWTYFMMPTGWSDRYTRTSRRTWTLYGMPAGGVIEQIGSANVTGGQCVKYYTKHYRLNAKSA